MPPANSPNETPTSNANDTITHSSGRYNGSVAPFVRREVLPFTDDEQLRRSLQARNNNSSISRLRLPSYAQSIIETARQSPSNESAEAFSQRTGLPAEFHRAYRQQSHEELDWQRDINRMNEHDSSLESVGQTAHDFQTPNIPEPPTTVSYGTTRSPMGGYNVERLQSIIRGEFLPRAPSPPVALSSSRDTVVSGGTNSRAATQMMTREQWRRAQAIRSYAATVMHPDTRSRRQDDHQDTQTSNPVRNARMNFPRPNVQSTQFRPVEEAIKYLTKLQQTPLELSVNSSSFVGKGFPIDDFLVDASIIQISPTSFLSNGAVFDGSQYAAPFSSVAPPAAPNSQTRLVSGTGPVARRPRNVAESNSRNDDKWNVKVTIHGIDYNTMKLSGSMYAMEVPDWQSASGTSSINTFWEGEIIDFQHHGLETINFTSTPQIDGTYWRKLEPFAGLNDLELAQNLVSKSFLKDLSEKWILMRWKEKCFVPPSSHESGLTISGFYFLCLKRSDGSIEGFYNDPHSSPYQQLSLKPTNRTFSTYDFR